MPMPNLPPIRPRAAARTAGGAALALLALLQVASPSQAAAQRGGSRRPDALRGSRASVEKMYEFAQSHRMSFYLTPTTLDSAVAHGRLVPLAGDANYELTRGVGFSYATREARQFVTQLAPQYLAACGTPLTVTSAARPMSRQPHNANPHSVHPTGIAVDLRRPSAGPCLDWIRASLARLEELGIVEATEERHPVHLHIAVLVPPGGRVALPSLTQGMVAAARVVPAPAMAPVMVAAAAPAPARAATSATMRRYEVKLGDTLWDVARRTGVTVKALARANHRSPKAPLKPGTVLVLPSVAGS